MVNTSRQPARSASARALVVGCLWTTLSAPAQTSVPAEQPTRLDPRAATKLLVSQVPPEYPSVAKFNFIQGSVRMQVTVTSEGNVGEAHVINGHPILAASALRTVRRWLFRPFRTTHGPAAFSTLVDVVFSLRSRKLTQLPSQPEEYLDRQVKPPEVLEAPAGASHGASVLLRVLVSDKGQAIDTRPLKGHSVHFETARRIVGCWTFKPARWGSVAIPWYLDVDVPVEAWIASRGAPDAENGCP